MSSKVFDIYCSNFIGTSAGENIKPLNTVIARKQSFAIRSLPFFKS